MLKDFDQEIIKTDNLELVTTDKFILLKIQDTQEKMAQRLEKYDFG